MKKNRVFSLIALSLLGASQAEAKIISKEQVAKHFIQGIQWCENHDIKTEFRQIPIYEGRAECQNKDLVLVPSSVKVRNSKNPVRWAMEAFDGLGSLSAGEPYDIYVIEAEFLNRADNYKKFHLNDTFEVTRYEEEHDKVPFTFHIAAEGSPDLKSDDGQLIDFWYFKTAWKSKTKLW